MNPPLNISTKKIFKQLKFKGKKINTPNCRIVKSLYLEGVTEVMNDFYKVGFLFNILIFIRNITLGVKGGENFCIDNSTLGVVFFPNEAFAAEKHNKLLGLSRVVNIAPNRLGFLLKTFGLSKITKLSIAFIKQSYKVYGLKALHIFAHPLAGWLLFNYFLEKLNQTDCKKLVVFNLAHPTSIAVNLAATQLGIACVYCEHAATPKLIGRRDLHFSEWVVNHNHTKNILKKYFGISENVRIINNIKINCKPIDIKRVKIIGICLNSLDELDELKKLIEFFQKNYFLVSCRVHDADPRFWKIKKIADQSGCLFSSARESRIEKYLQSVDLVIAGNTNVIGDCVLNGTPVIYYWPGSLKIYDLYGIVEEYGVARASNIIELENLLRV